MEVQIATTQKEVSRLTLLVAQNKVRLDSRNKRLMDVLKVIARNAFYKALAPFKQDYDNYRDDHDHFRQLTRCGGVLQTDTSQVTAYLLPSVNYPKKLRKILAAGENDRAPGAENVVVNVSMPRPCRHGRVPESHCLLPRHTG